MVLIVKVFCMEVTVLMLLAGEKGVVREHKSTFHAIAKIVRSEGVMSVYNG